MNTDQRAAQSACPAALGEGFGWTSHRHHPPSSGPLSPDSSTPLVPPDRADRADRKDIHYSLVTYATTV